MYARILSVVAALFCLMGNGIAEEIEIASRASLDDAPRNQIINANTRGGNLQRRLVRGDCTYPECGHCMYVSPIPGPGDGNDMLCCGTQAELSYPQGGCNSSDTEGPRLEGVDDGRVYQNFKRWEDCQRVVNNTITSGKVYKCLIPEKDLALHWQILLAILFLFMFMVCVYFYV
mmetsp:Transcript_8299/g.16756  ORF Transcript_8299/g.16756 Transcript_8299/m.16756 type:complete len:174 (-) Transcript_8299:89-610(-)|eukprot:CAMPEP_0118640796 /NCGR_PEP_ID=MMETSP0785-20121206/4940_1 /TAXON_ID=91992 /ORGANISM="Bolidomonas pacifica, Strain CCMP 1866" /LENGTH=173 /DNA_ID=CAMNT_0006532199 /DNA_START=85 /DNA_END=606 /DNA_ORIENTATION=-